MTSLLDTSALIGLTNPYDAWHTWASGQFTLLKVDGPILLIDIVLAEWSIAMRDRAHIESTIEILGLQRFRFSDAAIYRAGQAFKEYRITRKGPGKRVLPDMIIGAIAEIEKIPLVTTNPDDFISYFPEVRLIVPPKI